MSRHDVVKEVLLSLQKQIISIETNRTSLSETDTRQGLINPLFRALGWDFSDFESVRSEVRHKAFNEPVDYAFYSTKDQVCPILLLEAKKIGTNMGAKSIVKQICEYMGEFGVQWGVIADGNKYVLYNSRAGDSFDDKKFLTLTIKTMDTEDGIPTDELANKFIGLLSRECLENEEIQDAYEDHMRNQQIQRAMASLLSHPFDTLYKAVRKEFKEERVRANPNLKITKHHIESFFESIADEEGRIAVDLEAEEVHSDEQVIGSAARTEAQTEGVGAEERQVRSRAKRVMIKDLLQASLIQEGDNWRFESKGEVTWGRVVGNGQLEVNGKLFANPSRAAQGLVRGGVNGWYCWYYKNVDSELRRISELRQVYRDRHSEVAIS